MKRIATACLFLLMSVLRLQAVPVDTSAAAGSRDFLKQLEQMEQQRLADSLEKARLEARLTEVSSADARQREELQNRITALKADETERLRARKAKIDSMRNSNPGVPVLGISGDTLFRIYARVGARTPEERAAYFSEKVQKIADDDFILLDSIQVMEGEDTYDLVYGEGVLFSVTEADALWAGTDKADLAQQLRTIVIRECRNQRTEGSWKKLVTRLGLLLLVIVIAVFLFRVIGWGYRRLLRFAEGKQGRWLKEITYNNYTVLSVDRQMRVVQVVLNLVRWVVYIVIIYLALPAIFSIFPFSRRWAELLFGLIMNPVKSVAHSIWHYLPSLFSILVILAVFRYLLRLVRYFFREIENGKLSINGFHPDWAMPTFGIARFLLYAFALVLVFPYLPGSDSEIFKGVSVFVGILFSLGSSSAIANMVAGLVITYMRPFGIGDRIRIGDTTGDVVEKSMLVTRIRTVKNELVTIPNAALLNGNTINYSVEARGKGLILHTSVTIGYDAPWRDVHQALVDAAIRTTHVLQDPKPFVLQSSLDDFFVTYQINVYSHEAQHQALIYSELHQHIQDVFNERGIEILSPHFRNLRDGNETSIPEAYRKEGYRAPAFRVNRTEE
jgi:small-conductance mechanosensitive channel